MKGAQGWATASLDPTAGVRLYPRVIHCPRCGVEKGSHGHAKPGICRDCAGSLTAEERAEWGSRRKGGRAIAREREAA